MARVFITGSADGLGQLAAKMLVGQGHQVVLHARNANRARYALDKVSGAEKVLIADLSSMEETKMLADEVNALGSFDAIIHNAGGFQASGKLIFAVNSVAPYILTCLIQRPNRLIYISSGLHLQGDPSLKSLSNEQGQTSYSDSKLQVLILSKAVARLWPRVYSNAVDPGWVPTKMGGSGAPDNLQKGAETQVWLAASNDSQAKISGHYLHHQKAKHYLHDADNTGLQDQYLALCEQITGIRLPV